MPVLILADAIKILDIVDTRYPEFVDGANVSGRKSGCYLLC